MIKEAIAILSLAISISGCVIPPQAVTVNIPPSSEKQIILTEKPIIIPTIPTPEPTETPPPTTDELILSDYPEKYPLLENWRFPEGTCELAAKTFQKVYGGDLIFVQPLKDNGAFDLGEYNGAWMNYIWNSRLSQHYFIDYPNQRVFNTSDEVIQFYKTTTEKNYLVYNLNKERPPFAIINHY